MFEFIGNVLTSIAEFFSTVFNFVLSFFRELVYIVELVGSTILHLPSYFTWLPSTIATMLIAALGVVVVYKIAGRD